MGKGSWVTYCTTVFDDIWILIPPYTTGWITKPNIFSIYNHKSSFPAIGLGLWC